jgi:hypothetical protein
MVSSISCAARSKVGPASWMLLAVSVASAQRASASARCPAPHSTTPAPAEKLGQPLRQGAEDLGHGAVQRRQAIDRGRLCGRGGRGCHLHPPGLGGHLPCGGSEPKQRGWRLESVDRHGQARAREFHLVDFEPGVADAFVAADADIPGAQDRSPRRPEPPRQAQQGDRRDDQAGQKIFRQRVIKAKTQPGGSGYQRMVIGRNLRRREGPNDARLPAYNFQASTLRRHRTPAIPGRRWR